MDPITLTVLVLAGAYAVGSFIEEGYATIRGRPSPRMVRRRARREYARQYAQETGAPTLVQAISARLARRIAHPPKRRALVAFRRLVDEWLADAWEDARMRHRIRREERWEEWRAAREQARRDEEAGEPMPPPTVLVPCRGCGAYCVGPYCSAACEDLAHPPAARPDERTREPEPGHVCARCEAHPVEQPHHWCPACEDTVREEAAGPAPTSFGWTATEPAPLPDHADHDELQDGPAYSRRWEQPHPRRGTLRTTFTVWAQDDGERRWIVTETSWQHVDEDGTVLFEEERQDDSVHDGPSGEPWPTPEDVRRTADECGPWAPDETPLADVLDLAPCPACGTWTADDEPCPCTASPATETPEPNPAPDTPPINGEIGSPEEAVMFCVGAIALNDAMRAQTDRALGNLRAEGLGEEFLSLIGVGTAAAADFDATVREAGHEYVDHVKIKAEMLADPDLRDTVLGYLSAARF